MKTISLTRGKVALVDDEDYNAVSSFKWYAYRRGNTWYAARRVRDGKTQRVIKMHRFITSPPDGVEIDHKDSNGLNNQKNNLRLCNRSQNVGNNRPGTRNKSGYKGVFCHKLTGKWRASVGIGGKTRHISLFEDPKMAAMVRDGVAVHLWGEYAYLNMPERIDESMILAIPYIEKMSFD